MYEYTGEPTDSLRFSEVTLTEDQVVKSAKPLLGEKMDALNQPGLLPFFTKHQAPPLVILIFHPERYHVSFTTL